MPKVMKAGPAPYLLDHFTVPQCPWSYEQLLAMPPDDLRRIAADPKLGNAVRQLLDFTLAVKGRIRQETEAEEADRKAEPQVSEEEAWNDAYAAYLESEHWKRFRAKAIRKAGGRCERCGSLIGVLHVHHLHYRTLGQECLGDVQVVCRSCHKIIHGVYIDRSV